MPIPQAKQPSPKQLLKHLPSPKIAGKEPTEEVLARFHLPAPVDTPLLELFATKTAVPDTVLLTLNAIRTVLPDLEMMVYFALNHLPLLMAEELERSCLSATVKNASASGTKSATLAIPPLDATSAKNLQAVHLE